MSKLHTPVSDEIARRREELKAAREEAEKHVREIAAEERDLFPDDIETGESAEDALPHLFDIWDFDVMPKFDHAERYVRLRYVGDDADAVIAALSSGEPLAGRADDLLRTCRLYPAPLEDPLVREHLSHLTSGKKFKPIVMVVFADGRYQPDVIDGYHRLSVAWWCDGQMSCPLLRVTV